MLILAISTSSSMLSIALLDDDKCLKELNILNEKTHSEKLMPMIDEILCSCNFKISDVNLIAIDNGPGSFTGIRIGISTIKALAEVLNIPVVQCSSLEGLAYGISSKSKTICSLIDARNNQVYCGIFDADFNLVQNYLADDINNILGVISNYQDVSFIGSGAILHKDLLSGNFADDNYIHAKNIGICGYIKFKNGNYQTADSIVPMYLRKSQAERMKEQNV